MKFNTNNPPVVPTTPRQVTEAKYKRSRANLLLVIIASVINLFTLALNNSYFLFSLSLPSIPLEVIMMDFPEATFAELLIPIVIGFVLTLPYLICWIFSKKRPGWMVVALVFFIIDCFLLITLYDLTSVIFDILFHAWILFYLITGVKHGFKLKKMPEDEPLPSFRDTVSEEAAPQADVLPEEEISESIQDVNENSAEADSKVAVETSDEAHVSQKEEPVTARSFDEIMAENQKGNQ